MQISFSTLRANFNKSVGYGSAAHSIIDSLNDLGHETPYQTTKAPVQLNFSQPTHFKMHRNQYQIGYTPWESTVIPEEWKPNMKLCDEIWTTSDWCANVFEDNGFKDVKVFAHGIDDMWKPRKRAESDTIKFLHVGEPAPRKAGQMVVDAFISLYGNKPGYSLTIKAYKNNTTRLYNNYVDKQIIGLPDQMYGNIKIITDDYSQEDMLQLYYDHDVLVYPSYGEGFGFIPLQALATGMPTICVGDWAHYKKYLGPLKLKSTLIDSPWPFPHEGKVFEPDYQDLRSLMFDVGNNFKPYTNYYINQADKIHQEYNWNQLTENAFDHIVKKFQ